MDKEMEKRCKESLKKVVDDLNRMFQSDIFYCEED